MYLARELTPLSLAEIARGFDRDHSTVLHAIRAVSSRARARLRDRRRPSTRSAPPWGQTDRRRTRSTGSGATIRPDPPAVIHSPIRA